MFRRSLKPSRRGAAAIEYAVLLSLIVGGTTASISMMGATTRDRLSMNSTANNGSGNSGNTPTAPPGDGTSGGGSSGGGSSGGGSSGGGSGGSGSGSQPNTLFKPLHDNFDGKGNDNMQWQDVAGPWTTAQGERSSSDPDAATVAAVGSPDYTYKVTLQTTESTGAGTADTSRVLFRYQDPQNYYAVVTRKDGVVELAKMQDGQWRPALAYANTKTSPFKANDYQVRVAGSSIEVKVNGKTVMRYQDSNPVKTGGVGAANASSHGSMSKVSVTPNEG